MCLKDECVSGVGGALGRAIENGVGVPAMSSTKIAHLSFTVPTRVICGNLVLACVFAGRGLASFETSFLGSSASEGVFEKRGALTVDYVPYYNLSVSQLLEKT